VSEQEVDLRPEIFKAIVDQGWVLLELHRDAQKLEDVFRSLTIGDERRNRQLGAPADGAADEEDDEEDEDEPEDSDAEDSADDEKAAKEERS
jgi:ABC-2 type transport system ATP-binding protein